MRVSNYESEGPAPVGSLPGLGDRHQSSTHTCSLTADASMLRCEIVSRMTRPGARGRLGGRKPIRPDDPKVVSAKQLRKERSLSIDQICETLGIPMSTFYRYLAL